MRTAQVVPIVATGLLLSLALLAPAASANCGSLLPSPTKCVTAIVETERTLVNNKAKALQTWGQAQSSRAAQCPSVGVSFAGAEPALDAAESYASAMGHHGETLRAGATDPNGPFAAAGSVIGDGWYDSLGLYLSLGSWGDSLVMPLVPDLDEGTVVDPVVVAQGPQAWVEGAAASAQSHASSTAGCLASTPLPPL